MALVALAVDRICLHLAPRNTGLDHWTDPGLARIVAVRRARVRKLSRSRHCQAGARFAGRSSLYQHY